MMRAKGLGHSWGKRLGRWLLLAIAVVGLVVTPASWATDETTSGTDGTGTSSTGVAASAPSEVPVGNKIDGFPVLLDGKQLFLVREGVDGVTSAEERAAIISQRIKAIADNSEIIPDDIQAEISDTQSVVRAGETVLFTVREADANAYGEPHPELASGAVNAIQQGIVSYREERSLRYLATNLIAAIISTLVFCGVLRMLFLVSSKLLTRIRERRANNTLALNFQSTQLLGPGATSYLLIALVRVGRTALILLALYLYVPFVLSKFPATEALGKDLLKDVAFTLNQIIEGIVAYLPKLGMIALIVLITYFVIQFAKQVIIELGRHDVYPWFYPEWIRPTIRLVSLLIWAIAFVMAGPYLPGFGSPAFQGVSLFVGALLTLGSSSAVSNALAGIILIYTRAFQLGDFIRLEDIIGEVQDKSLFVTRVLTPKQETVTIPNASVLNSNVVNYSAICRESNGQLLLYTTITLGYDVPWRKVHDVLIEAALATAHIEAEPRPFVLQTDLNDFNVSYQLNAYTTLPTKMPRIYSELHQNIQDYCNGADIEILSPHFSALRDGNHSTIPADYLPEDYQSPSFVVQNADGHRLG